MPSLPDSLQHHLTVETMPANKAPAFALEAPVHGQLTAHGAVKCPRHRQALLHGQLTAHGAAKCPQQRQTLLRGQLTAQDAVNRTPAVTRASRAGN